MNAWLLSIVGVICLGLLLEIVMPEGQTTKYVRGAFSLLVIFVVIAPLPSLLGGDYKLTLDEVSILPDEEFVSETAVRYSEAGGKDIEDFLLLYGYTAEAEIVVDDGSVSNISRIEIKLKLSVLETDEANTHISRVRELVASRSGVEAERIFVSVEGDEYGSD